MSYLHEWRPDLRLKPSLTLAIWLAAIHVALIALMPFWQVPVGWRLFIVACVLVSWAHGHRKYVLLRAKGSVTRVCWCSDGWMVETATGLQGPLVLSGNSRVAKDFILLHFRRLSGWYRPGFFVPILRDSLDQESYHTLQIFLRWQKSKVLNPALHPQADTNN